MNEKFQPTPPRLYDISSEVIAFIFGERNISTSRSPFIRFLVPIDGSIHRTIKIDRDRCTHFLYHLAIEKTYQCSVDDAYKRWNQKALIIRGSNIASNRSSLKAYKRSVHEPSNPSSQKAYKRWNQSDLQETHKSFKETLLGGQVYKYQDTPLTGNTNAFYPPGRHPC